MLAGGGAAELEVARQLGAYGRQQTGLDQYAIAKFAEALEVVPRWVVGGAADVCRGEGAAPYPATHRHVNRH